MMKKGNPSASCWISRKQWTDNPPVVGEDVSKRRKRSLTDEEGSRIEGEDAAVNTDLFIHKMSQEIKRCLKLKDDEIADGIERERKLKSEMEILRVYAQDKECQVNVLQCKVNDLVEEIIKLKEYVLELEVRLIELQTFEEESETEIHQLKTKLEQIKARLGVLERGQQNSNSSSDSS